MSDHLYPEAATITASGAREMIAGAVASERARCADIVARLCYDPSDSDAILEAFEDPKATETRQT